MYLTVVEKSYLETNSELRQEVELIKTIAPKSLHGWEVNGIEQCYLQLQVKALFSSVWFLSFSPENT